MIRAFLPLCVSCHAKQSQQGPPCATVRCLSALPSSDAVLPSSDAFARPPKFVIIILAADSISVLQQQLQKVQALKRGYSQLHSCFLQHVSSLTREQQLDPPQKRGNIHEAAELETGNLDKPASTQEQPPNTTPPVMSPQPSAEGPSCEKTKVELLNSLRKQVDDLPSIARLEQSATSSVSLDQDRLDACAVLTGRKARYYVHQSTISVGRSSVHRGQV